MPRRPYYLQLADGLPGVALLCVDLGRDGLNLIDRELAAKLLHHFLLFGKPKIHACETSQI